MKKKLLKFSIIAWAVLLSVSIVGAGTTQRVSVDSAGNEGNADSWYPSKVAANGKIAFTSFSTNLVGSDSNLDWDVFVFDITNGSIEIVSHANDGSAGNGGWTDHPHISGDGNTVSFHSQASNLVENDTNSLADIFVRNSETPLVPSVRANLSNDGSESNYQVGSSYLSEDGTLLVFDSADPDLVLGDINDSYDVFVRDLVNNTIKIVSVAQDGTQGNGHSEWPSISADGNFVVFSSRSDNLMPSGTNGNAQVFVKNLTNNEIELISVDSNGIEGNNRSYEPAISANNRFISFRSRANNLVANDTNGYEDIFVHDRQTGVIERVNVHSNGTEANNNSDLWSGAISGDGRFVVFSSYANNLVDNDTNGFNDVFVHDRQTGITERVSVANDGTEANGTSDFLVYISADGRYISFESDASNIVANDTNDSWDIFVHDRYDNDGDGYADIAHGYDDCNDTPVTGAAINPGTAEICNDSVDNNCDGLIDDASCVRRFEICDDGVDNDGDNKIDCTDNDCNKDPLCP